MAIYCGRLFSCSLSSPINAAASNVRVQTPELGSLQLRRVIEMKRHLLIQVYGHTAHFTLYAH